MPSRGLQPEDMDAIDAFLTVNDHGEASRAARDDALRTARRLLGGPTI